MRAHIAASEFAVSVAIASATKYDRSRWNRVARTALQAINHDGVCLHHAIRDLSLSGWAFAGPILLRTLMEGIISSIAITQSSNPDLAGFKYFYAYAKDIQSDPNTTDAQRKEIKSNIKVHLDHLSKTNRELAKQYLYAQKLRQFWYKDEFGGPTEVLQKFSFDGRRDKNLFLYNRYSAASHFGFIGLRAHRDDPDNVDVNPRTRDCRAIGLNLLESARLLGEIVRIRAIFEVLPLPGFKLLIAAINKCRPAG